MKKLFLIRHAKSSWKQPELSDHERPLNKRGRHDAPLMAEKLKQKHINPDLIYSSSAVRAYEFAVIIAEVLNYNKKNIVISEKLYLASAHDMLDTVRNTSDDYQTVFLISHNPGITYFANELSGSSIDNIPTSGIAEIEFCMSKWMETGFGKGKLVSFDYPKRQYF